VQASAWDKAPRVASVPAAKAGDIGVELGVGIDPLERRQNLRAVQADIASLDSVYGDILLAKLTGFDIGPINRLCADPIYNFPYSR
jgi:hypothetical protein